mmetsp:Transcript_26278/g.38936  ORF Transcript_26278/g.38936 Transcript_26278/m.38936 type:complete len:887 (+) Transcript_26278:133-2793(+)
MSRLLSLRNVSKIKSRHVPVSNTCYNASSSSSSRLVTFGNSRIATGNAARNSSRFHTSSNSNASEKHLTAARLQLNLHSKPDEKGMPLLSELTAWVLQKVKVPKGFENFFPKNKGPVPKSSKTKSSKSAKEESPFQHLKDKKKAAGGGGKNKKDDDNQMISAAALLLLVLAARSMIEDDSGGNGREITWSDFYNHILEPGDVDRIMVINGKTARVFLNPGSPGVPLSRQGGSTTTGMGGLSDRSSAPSKRGQQKDPFQDETVLDLGTSEYQENASGAAASSLGSRAAAQSNRPLVYHFHIGSVESFEEKLSKSQEDLGVSPRDYVPVQYANETNWAMEAMKAAPAILMIGVMAYMMRGMGGMGGMGGGKGGPGGIFQVGKSNAKKINKEDVSVTFADVAGCQEAKKEIMEFVDFLKDSSRFTKLGAKIPKGALLCGPPGTGKTLLAKAVAGEAGVPFFSISGSDFIEMFVGVGPSRVRDLFKEARAEAPCIIFIDEIDAVGRKRGRGNMGGNDERENTLNQLLVEMDGFSPSTGVVVLAGTNRVDILDEALTRPGRFDRQVQVDKPDLKGRQEIFMVHLQGIKLDGEPKEFAGRMAGLTPGFTGADIANICNESAIVAARRAADSVTMDDFEKATDRIIGGLESNKIMSKDERSIVAHHEAGHAIAGWFLEHADPLLKVTIIPRSSGALGYAQYLPKEVFLRTQEQIMHIVMMALAGRAAEEVFFGNVTTGASDDLRRVTDLIYSTIQLYGMNPRVGQLAFPKDPNAMPGDKPYSDSTAEAMDEEAKKIVDEAYATTLKLIREKKDDVEKVANLLLSQETITHDDIIDLVGPRPFTGNEAYDEFVSKRWVAKKDVEEEATEEEEEKEEPTNNDVSGGLTPGLAFKV